MKARGLAALGGLGGLGTFWLLQPEAPTTGSDCEVLSTGPLNEPVAALSSLAIVAAGWVIARTRPLAGIALLLAGMASLSAHATAHPTARALDGIMAGVALAAVLWEVVRDRPGTRRLGIGLVIAGMGLGVWLLTRTDAPLCDTVGPWGHAAWHVLVAAAAATALTRARHVDE